MIRTEGLTKRFGDVVAVDGVSLEVREGEVFGFLGPNGAGKTTTVRMLAGLIAPSSGEGTVAGCRIGDEAEGLALRSRIGVLPENVGLSEGSSAYENLDYFGKLYGLSETVRRANIERLLRSMELWEKRDQPVGAYSKGMKQKVALARALVHDPPLLFLDEPTANLDPEAAKMVRDMILDLKKSGRTVFLNTHHLDEAERVCDRVGILRTRLLTVGAPGELRARVFGGRTRFRLERVTLALLEAARRAVPGATVETEGDTLTVALGDPDRENPVLAEALIAAGGRLREMTPIAPSLEEVYLRLVHETGGRR